MQMSLPLTRAWHTTLDSTRRCIITHDLFTFSRVGSPVGLSQQLVGRKVLVVKIVLDRVKVALWLISITATTGVSIGIASGRPEAGVAVSAIVLASVSALHGLSVLVNRWRFGNGRYKTQISYNTSRDCQSGTQPAFAKCGAKRCRALVLHGTNISTAGIVLRIAIFD